MNTVAPAAEQANTHFAALDGLRGVAVSMVMLLHFTSAMATSDAPATVPFVDRAFHALASGGWVGVDLFFALSGFLITSILLRSRGEPRYFRTFLVRRALRIFPLYYLVLALLFFVLPHVFSGAPRAELAVARSSQGWWWTYLGNVFLARVGTWTAAPFVLHFWSLAIEEQFYLVWPAVVRWTTSRRLEGLCVAILVAEPVARALARAAGISGLAVYVLTVTRLDSLAAGALVALILTRPVADPTRRVLLRRAPALAATAGAALLAMTAAGTILSPEGRIVQLFGYTLAAVLGAALVCAACAAAPRSRIYRALTVRPLQTLGKYSYGMYVYHLPIATLVALSGAFSGGALGRVGGSDVPAQLGVALLLALATLAVAAASWALVERRFVALKDRWAPTRKVDAIAAVPQRG